MKHKRPSSAPSTSIQDKLTARSPTTATSNLEGRRNRYLRGRQLPTMPVSSLTNPPVEDALTLLDTGFEQDGMLTLIGECEVEYDGRASSYLGPGNDTPCP